MKVRKQFIPLADGVSCTPVIDSVSLTQPEMSLSIKQIIDRFAFVGEVPLGMMNFEEPSVKDDELLFDSVDVERLDIAELEDLAHQLNERATWLRSQPPAQSANDVTMPTEKADAPPSDPQQR